MKTTIAIILTALLSSCASPASWEGTANPLDSPANTDRLDWHPAAYGKFGPFGNGRAYMP